MGKILIVEDNLIIRDNLKKIFFNLGHEVVGELEDIFNIVDIYQELQPDIVTLDLMLKKTDGLQALKVLKKRFPNSKIIIISVVNNKKDIFNALTLGADYFIIKPINQEKVENALKKLSNSQIKISKIRNLYNQSVKKDTNKYIEDIIDVQNINGVFKINIKKPLNGNTIEILDRVIDNFLIIKPLNIIFTYFDENESIQVIKKALNDIMIKIKNKGGECDIEF
ncbi:response regulator [Marinitoga sp. 38H-ov]|uniref:response regulator n=1 Tax=Marinitoga sp. 38H-ov TaxID=1755814 RepID=UPI0013EA43B8|nr:response regulator [Marinitoga sp. 38H-ov]KAF2956592.1 hypothetical protein AS160_05185 [Marinitoga sp. 38H-ov]